MFLEKIKKLADDWGKPPAEMQQIAKESLLYGMRIERTPGKLKRELKKVRIDSTLATPLWSGNYYLLLTLPVVLSDRNKKIPDLEDFLFAKKILSDEQIHQVEDRVKNLSKVPTQDIFNKMVPAIKRQTKRGRFLPQFDSMHSGNKDIEQDLTVKAIEIMNKELMNFNTPDIDEIAKYLSYCFVSKSDTYLKAHTPRFIKARIEDEKAFDKIVEDKAAEDFFDLTLEDCDFRQDLRKVLSKTGYKAVSLLMGFADQEEEQKFLGFLESKGLSRKELAGKKLKNIIEKYIGYEIFDVIKNSSRLKDYLKNR